MKKLKWGQTPFDRMTKTELKENAIRMYDALILTRSCLKMDEANNLNSLYWSKFGSGGRSLNKANQAIKKIHQQFHPEQIYRMFYRYASNLIFYKVDDKDWYICDKDKTMYSPGGIKCLSCKGKLRLITMEDLTSPRERE